MTTPTTLTPAAPTRKPSSCSECSLATIGKGFCLGAGDPVTARLALILETPANEEIGYFLRTDNVGVVAAGELERRRVRFPELPSEYVDRGVPVVGRTGSILNNWILPKAGVRREEIFVDNVLRCLPSKSKQGKNYPTGKDRNVAELACRQYDRIAEFAPDVIIVTIHPAACLREITPLPLIIRDLEKAVAFTRQGYKVMVVMGGFAAEAYLGYASNVSKWRGHYQVMVGESARWLARVTARLTKRAERGTGKGKRVSKAEQLRRGGAMGEVDAFDEALGWTASVKKPRVSRKKVCEVCTGAGVVESGVCHCGAEMSSHSIVDNHAPVDNPQPCVCKQKKPRKPRAKSAKQLAKALAGEMLVNLRENVAVEKVEREL